MKDRRETILAALRPFVKSPIAPATDSLLIIGAGSDDVEIARLLGFQNISCTNLDASWGHPLLDAENLALPDNSYDVVFAHAVLHHCMSPHKAVLEAVRVARKGFIFVDPNDSLLMRAAMRFGASMNYELTAVMDNGYASGGMRNTAVPNYNYRWNVHELEKTVYSGFPHLQINIKVWRFFDFYMNPHELDIRTEPVLRWLRSVFGSMTLIRGLRSAQKVINRVPGIRAQGNHFLALISKGPYMPWIDASNGHLGLRSRGNGSGPR